MKESLYGIDKRVVFRETFQSEDSVRKNGGVPTNVTFSEGVGAFNGTSSYMTCLMNRIATVSVRLRFTSITPTANSYFVDFRRAGTTGSGYILFNAGGTAITVSSGTVYVDGVVTSTVTSSTKEIIVTGISIDSTLAYLFRFNGTSANFLPCSIELLEIYQGTLTANEVKNLYENKFYKYKFTDSSIENRMNELGYVYVSPLPPFTNKGFFVAKYHMKASKNGILGKGLGSSPGFWDYAVDSNIIPVSTPEGVPITNITFTQAYNLCRSLNNLDIVDKNKFSFKLMTNRHWMSIARQVERNPVNWSTGIVGSGYIPRGNSNLGVSLDGTDALSGINFRVLYANNDGIWDLAGNVWEWVDLMEDGSTFSSGNACGGTNWFSFFGADGAAGGACAWQNYYAKTDATDKRFELGPSGNFNSANGVGRIYSSTSAGRVLLRGGRWNDGAGAGVFASRLSYGPTYSSSSVGFRCVIEILR